MTQADAPLLIVGFLFLALACCGILTGCSTTRTNTSFAENPMIWCIGAGMQLFISILCLVNSVFIAKLLGVEWLHQAITNNGASNRVLLPVIFLFGSSICGAICFGARKLVLAWHSGRNSESLQLRAAPPLPQQSNLAKALNSNALVESASALSRDVSSNSNSNLIQVNYSKNDRVFYGILTLCFSGLFALMSYATVYSFPWQWHWSSTTGVISEVRQSAKMQNVEYSYSADNRNFVAHERFHWHGMLLHKGDSVVVRYDPALVVRSAIQTGPTIATGLWIVCSLFSLVAAIAQFKAPTGPAIGMKWKLY